MDLVQYSQEIYKNISNEYYKFSQGLNFETISTIPMSATLGDNITNTSSNMPWYNGPCFLEYIENIEIENNLALKPFRMPVQWVNRANIDFRGYAGKICAGQVNIGDHIILAKNGIKSKVKNIYLGENELQSAYCGQSIILTLEAVSYTHLDVYKRQTMYGASFFAIRQTALVFNIYLQILFNFFLLITNFKRNLKRRYDIYNKSIHFT